MNYANLVFYVIALGLFIFASIKFIPELFIIPGIIVMMIHNLSNPHPALLIGILLVLVVGMFFLRHGTNKIVYVILSVLFSCIYTYGSVEIARTQVFVNGIDLPWLILIGALTFFVTFGLQELRYKMQEDE